MSEREMGRARVWGAGCCLYPPRGARGGHPWPGRHGCVPRRVNIGRGRRQRGWRLGWGLGLDGLRPARRIEIFYFYLFCCFLFMFLFCLYSVKLAFDFFN